MIRLSSIFMVVFFLGAIGLGVMHEQVHVAIYSGYGVESHVEYFGHGWNFVTIAEERCPTEMCEFAQNLNEIIGYPLLVLYVVFGIFCEIMIILKEESLINGRR